MCISLNVNPNDKSAEDFSVPRSSSAKQLFGFSFFFLNYTIITEKRLIWKFCVLLSRMTHCNASNFEMLDRVIFKCNTILHMYTL